METSHQVTKSKAVYTTIKQITKKSNIRMQAVKSKDGEILTEMKDVQERWKESFEELYNNQNQTNGEAINIPQMANLDPVPGILRDEVEYAVRKLAEEKAPGFDSITGEAPKAAGSTGITILHNLCNKIWLEETFPADWGKAIITPIYKEKRQTQLWKLPGY